MSDSAHTALRSELKQWRALETHREEISSLKIPSLFSEDANRFKDFSIEHEGLLFDYSKHALTAETRDLLIDLARACDLESWRERMFSGDIINHTEGRAVLHTALRNSGQKSIHVDGADIVPRIQDTLGRMKKFCDKVRSEKTFKHIVNIGIGGSDLGSSLVYNALKPFCDSTLDLHFVSNVDAAHLLDALEKCDPANTLFIVTSKTFTTSETLENAKSAKQWLLEHIPDADISDHFVGVTSNVPEAQAFGLREDNIFPLWDWVGGRYSVWSAVGLPCAIAMGYENFEKFLSGAHSIDQHFRTAPLEENIPVLMGLIGVWYRNFCHYPALAVIPYAQHLCRFGSYLQGLDMESNGKAIDRQGRAVPYETGPFVLGETGTNAQHAFFQLVHQGTTIVPCEFIAIAKAQHTHDAHHTQLLANVLGQAKALMDGKDDSDPNKFFAGNRPSTMIVLDELTPYTLGMLLALYEHKIFVQGIIWNINSFDQCGVELGKQIAKNLIEPIRTGEQFEQKLDQSTAGIINFLK